MAGDGGNAPASTREGLLASGVPREVVEGLTQLCTSLRESAAEQLAGVILYGGVARGRYRPDKSDIDLAVILHDASAEVLQKIGPVLHRAWQAQRVEPLILALSNVPALASAFPVTLLDIQERHVCLWGTDPFQGLAPPIRDLRKRITQELWNLNLRLRRRLLFVTRDLDEQWRILSEISRPLAIELNWMLYLLGKHVQDNDRTAAIFEIASKTYSLDAEALAALAQLRQSMQPPPPSDLYPRILAIVDRCAHQVNDSGEPA